MLGLSCWDPWQKKKKRNKRSLRTFFHQIYSFDRNLVVICYAFRIVLWLLWWIKHYPNLWRAHSPSGRKSCKKLPTITRGKCMWKGDAQSSVELNGKNTLIMTNARRNVPLRTWYEIASPRMWSCCLSAVLQRLVSSCLFSFPLSNDDFNSNFTEKIKVSKKELPEVPSTILSTAPTPYNPLIPPWSHSLPLSHAVLTPLLLHRPPQYSSLIYWYLPIA